MLHFSNIFSNPIVLSCEHHYLGCIIFALTSLVAVLFYIYYNNENHVEYCTNDNTSIVPIKEASNFAIETNSFLAYLRKLDKNEISFPNHCRTIDFYLACRNPEKIEMESAQLDPMHLDPVQLDPVHVDPIHLDPQQHESVHVDPINLDNISMISQKYDDNIENNNQLEQNEDDIISTISE
jgi:hypothetical protein